MRRALCLAPAFNTPNRKDASGAFQPEARAFVASQQLAATIALFDSNRALADRRYECARIIARQTDLDVIALFCHGWRDGVQAGWRIPNAGHLADLLVLASRPTSTVILYACDAARDQDADRKDDTQPGPGGTGGFADVLDERMRARGWQGRLFAHSTPGHTTTNPYVRCWAPGERGQWVIEPSSADWRPWRAALQGDLRFRFPFLTRDEVRSVLQPS